MPAGGVRHCRAAGGHVLRRAGAGHAGRPADGAVLIMSDTDDSFNFLISMCYTQLFNLLCEKADDVYGGRCRSMCAASSTSAPTSARSQAGKLVATIRSREISACLVLQAQSQLKAIYKDNADTIIGNMDSSIFLGGKERPRSRSWKLCWVRRPSTPTTPERAGDGRPPTRSTIKIGERADEPG